MRVLNRRDKAGQGLPELVDVFAGFWKVVRKVDFRFPQLAKLVDGELEAVLIFVDETLDLEEIVLLEGLENLLDVVPHFGFELPGAVAESQREVGLAGFLGLDLLGDDDEAGSDDLVFLAGAVADIEIFHGVYSTSKSHRCRGSPRNPHSMPSFFFPFFLLFFWSSFLESGSLGAAVSTGWVWLALAPVSTKPGEYLR